MSLPSAFTETPVEYEGNWDTDRLRKLAIELRHYQVQANYGTWEVVDEMLDSLAADYRRAAKHENGED